MITRTGIAKSVAVAAAWALTLTVTACSAAHPADTVSSASQSNTGSSRSVSQTPASVVSSTSTMSTPTAVSSSVAVAKPALTTPKRTVDATSASGASYPIKIWYEDTPVCGSSAAFGAPVIAFLNAHPCTTLNRRLSSTLVHQRPVGISMVTVQFPNNGAAINGAPAGYANASNFATLLRQDGTGSMKSALGPTTTFLGSGTAIGDPDAFLCFAQDEGTVIFDAWYLDGPTPENDPALMQLLQLAPGF